MLKKSIRIFSSLVLIIAIVFVSLYFIRSLFPVRYTEEISSACEEFNVSTELANALIKAESNFNPDAKSPAGAKGIMQITKDTFDFCNTSLGIGKADILNPKQNIRAGVWYISYLLEKYNGNTENALAAYNAGMGNVDKWLNDKRYSDDGKTLKRIPFSETAHYIEKIKRYRIIYRFM